MIPFCRTLGEADRVLETLAEEGLVRGRGRPFRSMSWPRSRQMSCWLDKFAQRFDGFSIGSNDLRSWFWASTAT